MLSVYELLEFAIITRMLSQAIRHAISNQQISDTVATSGFGFFGITTASFEQMMYLSQTTLARCNVDDIKRSSCIL